MLINKLLDDEYYINIILFYLLFHQKVDDCGAVNFGMKSHVSDLMLKNGLYKCYILLYMYLRIMNYFNVFIIKKILYNDNR